MTVAHLNRWYDALPESWRFQVVLLPLLALGAINMALTVSAHFPFGLLVLLGIFVLGLIRAPLLMGWLDPAPTDATAEPTKPAISVAAVPWVYDLNLWYDGLPETRQPWVFVAVLVVAGGLNMLLTIHTGFAFGILFLLALLAIVAIRGPYEAGWLIPPVAPAHGIVAVPVPPEQIAQEVTMPAAPMTLSAAEPVPVMHAAPPPEADKPV